MCEAMEKMRDEAMEEGMRRGAWLTATRMLKAGKLSLEEIAEMAGLSIEEVKKLQAAGKA